MESVEGGSPVEIKPSPLTQDILVDGHTVSVFCTEFTPPRFTDEEREKFDPAKAVIFLPGWPWKADKPITYPLPQSLAEGTGAKTFSIYTRVREFGPDSLRLESAGIAEFLGEQGLNGVTIVGHSEGAIRAVDLAVILQEQCPGIGVNGVVLLNPMGMDKRSRVQLVKDFLFDVFGVSGQEREKAGVDNPKGLKTQFVQSLLRDIAFAGVRYPKMLLNQMKNLVNINPYLAEIKAPVVIMVTDRDLVSDLRKYLPQSEVESMQPPQTEEELIDEIGRKWDGMDEKRKTKYGTRENYIERHKKAYQSRKEMASLTRARQQYLKQTLLSKAENVVFLVGTRHADHGGIVDYRHKAVAHIISGIFDRLKRPKSI
ncbi:alpha/beta hydrolase [Patescibacteria group bacterium]|nr:alpha/beta hydrolase [Patescibacteria group bacterium]